MRHATAGTVILMLFSASAHAEPLAIDQKAWLNYAIIVNTSRGAVIDETALYEALRDGKIAGAGLDVLEQEPTPESNPLLELDNTIVTPHTSGVSRESGPRGTRFALENARRAVLGQPVQSIIKP